MNPVLITDTYVLAVNFRRWAVARRPDLWLGASGHSVLAGRSLEGNSNSDGATSYIVTNGRQPTAFFPK